MICSKKQPNKCLSESRSQSIATLGVLADLKQDPKVLADEISEASEFDVVDRDDGAEVTKRIKQYNTYANQCLPAVLKKT